MDFAATAVFDLGAQSPSPVRASESESALGFGQHLEEQLERAQPSGEGEPKALKHAGGEPQIVEPTAKSQPELAVAAPAQPPAVLTPVVLAPALLQTTGPAQGDGNAIEPAPTQPAPQQAAPALNPSQQPTPIAQRPPAPGRPGAKSPAAEVAVTPKQPLAASAEAGPPNGEPASLQGQQQPQQSDNPTLPATLAHALPTPKPKPAASFAGAGAAEPVEQDQTQLPVQSLPQRTAAPANVAQKSSGSAAPVQPAAEAVQTRADANVSAAPQGDALAAISNSHTQPQPIADSIASVRALPATTQVSHEIVRRFTGQSAQFELRLDPPELGRIEVRLEVGRDHRVTAAIAADSPQALVELARHARELEQSLQAAGLELRENGLSFDLRQRDARKQDDTQSASASHDRALLENEAPGAATARARPVGFERWRGVRVDITA
jgi:flagellar hook-length control protein FliK